MFKRWIEKWKEDRDHDRMGQIFFIYKKFYSLTSRKEFLVDLILREQFTPEELDQLSNIIGREAHARVRYQKALDRAREYYRATE